MPTLFGYEFKRKDKQQLDQLQSFAPKEQDDGAVVVSAGGAYGTYVDLDGSVRTEAELVTKYRDMAAQPECDAAVDEIINESISIDEEHIVNMNLDATELSPQIKKVFTDEFNNCVNLLDFNKFAYDIYRRWYIDGRLYFHAIVDEKNPKEGIQELRYIDPRKIRKIREIVKKPLHSNSTSPDSLIQKTVQEYFIYNDKGFASGNKTQGGESNGLKIAKDSILHVVSGLTDNQGSLVLSYLHKSIKALNQLRTLEDALVIYRLARAPERRIWYIDVGNLPKMKAEQYVRDIMVKHKNRLIYDATTGEVRDDRKFMTMLEDYWLPRREGGRGTEVTTLPGGQTLGQMDDVLYFQKKFLQTLNVPVSRLNSDALFSLGRATEITRDEVKFSKFVVRLRSKFAILFSKILEKQLILKGIITPEEWSKVEKDIKFDFARDNYFSELKDNEIIENRVNLARNVQDVVGKYVSNTWVRKTILRQTDEDIESMDEEILAENESGDARWINPMIQNNMALEQQSQQGQPGDDQGQQGEPPQPGQQSAGVENTQGGDPELQKKMQAVRTAQVVVSQMAKKKGNRSIQDESKYKAAIQIVAKNKDLLSKMGVPQKQNNGA